MNKKIIVALLAGIAAAALICCIVGIIVYFTASQNVLDASLPNYSALNAERGKKLLIGLILMLVGSVFFVLPASVLVVLMIIFLVSRFINKVKK